VSCFDTYISRQQRMGETHKPQLETTRVPREIALESQFCPSSSILLTLTSGT
jgi:hypothetical protein